MKSQKMIEAGKKAWATRRANAAAKLAAQATPPVAPVAVKVLNTRDESVELTDLELKVMEYFASNGTTFLDEYNENGYLLIALTDDISNATGLSLRQLAGVIGSLDKKHIAQTDYIGDAVAFGKFNDKVSSKEESKLIAIYFAYRDDCVEHPQYAECKFWG